MKQPILSFALAALLIGAVSLAAHGQIVSTTGQSRPMVAKPDSVAFLFPQQVSVAAGKPSPVALHFRVAKGLHINSHTPSEQYLIPTDFSIPEEAGVRLVSASYPAGTMISLPFDLKSQLGVYTGEFIIEARIVATAGNHRVEGRLRFQACDQNQCMPPKTLNVPIDVVGK